VRALSYLIIIFLAPAIILLNFRLLVFNEKFYQNLQSNSGVPSQIDSQLANYQTKKLIKFLCCNQTLDGVFFTQREIAHMQDVKKLIKLANIQLALYSGLMIPISFYLLYKSRRKLLFAAFKGGSAVGLITIAALSITSFLNFDFLFLNFHLISFQNDLWMLPAGSNLLTLFPQQFFVDFANRIAYQSLLMLGIIYLLSSLLSRANSKK